MIRRILSNTRKQIFRSGWTAWASVSVMTLAFLIASIFGGLAYVSNLYIQFIESKSNILVFFNVGIDPKVINDLNVKWSQNPKIKKITFESEDDAYKHYSDVAAVIYKESYEILKTFKNKKLPSNLDIQIYSLSDLQELEKEIQSDIDITNTKLEIINTDSNNITSSSSSSSLSSSTNSTSIIQNSSSTTSSISTPNDNQNIIKYKYSVDDPTKPPVFLKVDDASLEKLRHVLYSIRIAGIAILSLLFIVVFFFTFMTVEFRLHNQIEEIGVMQLVGGSLFFIRAPYLLEGGFYGLAGALLSSLVIGSLYVWVFIINKQSDVTAFIYENFSNLPWPNITILGWILIISILSTVGFILGAGSSYVSIRRYIR